ncbi:hypothetical protein OF83DRAFT_1167494 [Amylostereum chailletii]|nr:hypothetical protein OF83DRAFT_1167494 [Amylostereum chailletii]
MDDDAFSLKRPMTESQRTSSASSFNSSANDLISPDLTTRLQNVGSRVRRSKLAGYRTDQFAPTTSYRQLTRSTSTPHGMADNNPIFRSANDTLHAVYSQTPRPAIAATDRKRGHAESSIDEDDEGREGGEARGSDADEMAAGDVLAAGGVSQRPIKPLRRNPRSFGQTQSLPANVFGASNALHDQASLSVFPSVAIEEEEDWSSPNFSGTFSSVQTFGPS